MTKDVDVKVEQIRQEGGVRGSLVLIKLRVLKESRIIWLKVEP
jgi:hypothetical protein